MAALSISRPMNALLKDWDVISALRGCGKRNLGREGRCRYHDVDIGVNRMAKVPRKP